LNRLTQSHRTVRLRPPADLVPVQGFDVHMTGMGNSPPPNILLDFMYCVNFFPSYFILCWGIARWSSLHEATLVVVVVCQDLSNHEQGSMRGINQHRCSMVLWAVDEVRQGVIPANLLAGLTNGLRKSLF